MYNNDITYHEKWETPENKAALAILEKKYFAKSECSPSCPVSWAPEVLEMMDTIERELGFRRNERTMHGYYIQGRAADWFIKNPWSGFFSSFRNNFLGKPYDYTYDETKTKTKAERRVSRSFKNRIKSVLSAVAHPISYGFRACMILYVNPRLNQLTKPKVTLGQLKEKYGSLTCYFHTSDAFEEFVDNEVRKCEIKLAMKGAYYPVESFWDAGTRYDVGNEWRPDVITSTVAADGTITVTETKYRAAMKELGLDLKDIQAKAELAKAAKAKKV